MAYDKIPSLWEDRHSSRDREAKISYPSHKNPTERGREREREYYKLAEL